MAKVKVAALAVGCLVHSVCTLAAEQTPLGNPASPPPKHLQLTAVTHDPAPPHDSRIQCLNITSSSFHTYPTVGSSLFLSTVTNATYVTLPPRSEEGWHRPPHPMFFVLLAGQARVETPSTGDAIWIEPGGRSQLLLALDVLGKGHLTFYPSDRETLALQVPLAADEATDMSWEVVGDGACR